MSFWAPYVPVAERRARAMREMNKRRKKGEDIQPVNITGRKIVHNFWGKSWCDHLESFSDYANRLPRGRTYARNGSVCHLAIQPGRIEAVVSGSELYNIVIDIKKLKPTHWKAIKQQCTGQIGSMLELLQGKLSDQVMAIVTDRKRGLLPQPNEIKMRCDCPDWAGMCKHVAAVLYGAGNRLDNQPELLFLLRDVDAAELISAELTVSNVTDTDNALASDQLGDIFGIDLDTDTAPKAKRKRTTANAKRKQSTAPKNPKPAPAKTPSISRLPKLRPTGKSVARLRQKSKLSVAQFAKQLGVTPTSVYRWEATSGRLSLQERPLQALAMLQQQQKK